MVDLIPSYPLEQLTSESAIESASKQGFQMASQT